MANSFLQFFITNTTFGSKINTAVIFAIIVLLLCNLSIVSNTAWLTIAYGLSRSRACVQAL